MFCLDLRKNICDAAQVWGGPRATEHTKEMPPTEEAGLLNALNNPQPKEVAVYGLYGPAQAKQIKDEMRQTHTYYNKWPLWPRGSLLPCELKCPSNRSVPPTAPTRSICFKRNSKTDPEVLAHLNL